MESNLPYVIYDTTGIYFSVRYGGKTSVVDNVDDDLEYTDKNVIDPNNEFKYKGVLYTNVGDYVDSGKLNKDGFYYADTINNIRYIKHIQSKQPDILIVNTYRAYLIDLVKPAKYIIVSFVSGDSVLKNMEEYTIKSLVVNGSKYYDRLRCGCDAEYDPDCEGCNHVKCIAESSIIPEHKVCTIKHNCKFHIKYCVNYNLTYRTTLDKCIIECLKDITPTIKPYSACSGFLTFAIRCLIDDSEYSPYSPPEKDRTAHVYKLDKCGKYERREHSRYGYIMSVSGIYKCAICD